MRTTRDLPSVPPETRITIEKNASAPKVTLKAHELKVYIESYFASNGCTSPSILASVVESEFSRIIIDLTKQGKTTGVGDRVISL